MEKKEKNSFYNKKNNAIKSLTEVECFLNKSNIFSKYYKLYKAIKNNKN